MLTVVCLWGLGPPVTKLITAPALVSVSIRFWFSAPIVLAMAYASGRRMSFRVMRYTALPGALFACNLVVVFIALKHTSVAVTTVIQSLQPGIVLLVAGRWMGERATTWHVAWTAVGLAGVVVVVTGGNAEVRGNALGIACAVGSMLIFTTYYLINRRVRFTHNMDPIEWITGIMVFAALAITPVALLTSSPDDYRQVGGIDWLYLAFVGGIIGIVGHTMMSWAHKFIPASRSSLYLLGMNIVAVSAAWPLHDEPVTVIQVVGGAIVLGSLAAVVSRPASVRVTRAPQPEAPDLVVTPAPTSA
jgi:drug/metabolite transporter (DMT)-like permease